jgi:hypothetical protein
MTNQEIKNIFDQQWDAYASGIIEDADLDSIFQKSTQITLKKLYNQLDLDNSFTTELVPLIKETTLATASSTINVVADLPATDPDRKSVG